MGDNGDSSNLSDWGADLVEGGLQNAATSLLGYGLNSMGLGFPDATSGALAELQSELNLIETQLVALQGELNAVNVKIDQTDYGTRYGLMTEIVGNIDNLAQQLATVASEKAASPSTDYSAASGTIKDSILADLVSNQSLISLNVLGPPGGQSIYELYSQLLKDSHRFLSAADSNAVQSLIDYYQSHQFTQLVLIVQYYHYIANSDGLVTDAINDYQAHIAAEAKFQVTTIPENVAIDQQSNLMIYLGDNPYVDHNTAVGTVEVSDMDGIAVLGFDDWRLPTLDELLSGVFSGYDSSGGTVTPPQWLVSHGFPKDITGIHFWTSTQVPPPNREEYGRDVFGYDRAQRAWEDNGGENQHYYVDSSNLGGAAPIPDTAQAHVVAVRNIQPGEKELLKIQNS